MALKNDIKGFADLAIAIVAIPPALWLFVTAPKKAPGLYEDGIQPWLYPRIVLFVLILFCLLMAFAAVKRRVLERRVRGGGAGESTIPKERDAPIERQAVLNAIVPTGLTVLYVIGTIWIGYIYTTAIIASLYMLYLGASILGTMVVATGLTLVVHFVFGDLLNIPLPLGRLFG